MADWLAVVVALIIGFGAIALQHQQLFVSLIGERRTWLSEYLENVEEQLRCMRRQDRGEDEQAQYEAALRRGMVLREQADTLFDSDITEVVVWIERIVSETSFHGYELAAARDDANKDSYARLKELGGDMTMLRVELRKRCHPLLYVGSVHQGMVSSAWSSRFKGRRSSDLDLLAKVRINSEAREADRQRARDSQVIEQRNTSGDPSSNTTNSQENHEAH